MKERKKVHGVGRGSVTEELAKITARRIVLFFSCLLLATWTLSPPIVQAEVEWKILKDLDLKATPLDMAPSVDGKWLFILTPGEILIFSVSEGTLSDRIPVDKDFDRIAPLRRPDLLSLTSSAKKTLRVIHFESIYKFDLTGLPYKGPQEAPVILAIFDDYQ